MCLAKRAKWVLGVVGKAAENVTEKPAYPVPNQEAPWLRVPRALLGATLWVPFWIGARFGTGAGHERWLVRVNREKTTAFQTCRDTG